MNAVAYQVLAEISESEKLARQHEETADEIETKSPDRARAHRDAANSLWTSARYGLARPSEAIVDLTDLRENPTERTPFPW